MGGIKVKNEVGEVRPGQLITTYGPGAIMDSINDSLVILDINYWGDNLEEIYDNRLSGFLKKICSKKYLLREKKICLLFHFQITMYVQI